MSQPQLAVKILANADQFKAALAQSQSAIQALGPSVENLQQNWKAASDKLIQSAQNIAAAIDKVGTSSMTAGQAATSLRTVEQALAQLARSGAPIPPQLEATATQLRAVTTASSSFTDKIREQALGFATGLVSVQAFEAAGHKLIDFFHESIAAAAESERTQSRLHVAMTAQGTNVASIANQYERLAQSTQDVTTFSDEAARELETMLIQVGNVLPDQMAKAVGATTDLASAMGVDLDTAARTMSKAAEGNTTAMRKMGIQLDETRVKGEGLEYIAGQVEARFGGQATAELDTYAGKMKQIANRWDDVKESIGNVLIKIIETTGALDALQVRFKLLTMDWSSFRGDTQASVQGMGAFVTELKKARIEGESYEAQMLRAAAAGKKAADAVTASGIKTASFQYPSAGNHAATVAAEAAAQEAAAQKIEESNKKAADAIRAHALAIKSLADQLSGAAVAVKVRDLAEAFNTLTPAQRASSEVMQRVAKDADELQKQGGKLSPELQRVWRDFVEFSAKVDISSKSLTEFLKVYGLSAKQLETTPLDFSLPVGQSWGAGLDKLLASTKMFGNGALKPGEVPAKTFSMQFGDYLKGDLPGQVSGAFARAFEGGGNVLGAVQSLASTFGAKVGSMLGMAMGGPWGKAAGEAIGALAGPLVGKIAGLFAGNAGHGAATDFVAQFGGFDAFHQMLGEKLPKDAEKFWIALTQEKDKAKVQQTMADIEAALAALPPPIDWSTASMEDLLAAIEKAGNNVDATMVPALQRLADTGDLSATAMRKMMGLAEPVVTDWKAMETAATKYGIALDQMGKGFQQGKLDDTFGTLASDFKLLVDGGANLSSVLDKMAPQVNAAVQDALKYGTTIPATMKPMIEAMIKAGELVDANGNKLTDLGALNFAVPIEDSMKELVALFKEFLAKIAAVPGELAKIPRNVPITLDLTTSTDGRGAAGAALGGLVTDAGVRYLARGGRVLPFVPRGTDTVPAMLTPGEGIVNTRGMSYLGTGGLAAINHGDPSAVGSTNVTVNIHAIDSQSLDAFLRNGGGAKITSYVVKGLPAEKKRRVG